MPLQLTNLNMNQNEVQNAVIQKLATAPTVPAPVEGQIYYNTASHRAFQFNGSIWIGMDAVGATMTGSDIVTAINGSASIIDGDNLPNEIAALQSLADTAGFVKKTGDGAYSIDTATYGTSNLAVADLSGTAMTSGGTAVVGVATTAARSDHKHAFTNPAIDTLAAATDIVTLNASTSAHGLLVKATAPASGLMNFVGLTNGETAYTNKPLFDSTNPANIGTANPGTSLIAARRDHVHADSLSHSQNTDTGTSSTTFMIGTTGPRIKNSSGEIQMRNTGDTDYADIRVKNLTVEGTTTTINSNDVNIGDSEIVLNSDITTNAANSDGGLAIKRLMADNTTRKDALLTFNNSTGKWQATQGAVAGTLITTQIATKVVAAVGDASATSFVITHNLNSRDISVSIRKTASDYAMVIADVEMTTVDTITVRFAVAPTASQYTVTIIG